MKLRIRWGIVGVGGVFTHSTVVEGLLEASHAEVVAVCGVTRELLAEITQRNAVQEVATFDELLRSGIDAVFIAGGIADRVDLVARTAGAGKHVLCEELFGEDIARTRQMLDVCRTNGVLLGSAFFMRFVPQFQQVLGLIRDDVLGRLMYGRVLFSDGVVLPEVARTKQLDTLGDIGCHCIDLLEMFFGEARMLHCFSGKRDDAEGSSAGSMVVTLYFDDDAMAHIYASVTGEACRSQNIIELYGSKGHVTVEVGEMRKVRMKLFLNDRSAEEVIFEPRYRTLPDDMNPYLAEIEEFCGAILEGDTPYNNAELGLRSQYLLDACRRSVREGVSVNLPYSETVLALMGLICCV